MAEYQEVMRHLGRMCETYPSCSDGCPLQAEPNVCFLSAKSLSTEKIKSTEQAVMKWAAENPEPVYPTLVEWLHSIGLANHRMIDPIPADIAEKLGIEPKEG